MAAIAAVLTTALALPLAVLAREALGSRSIAAVIAGSGEAIANSLRLATVGASAVVGIALWLGYARARTTGRVGQLVDVALVVLFAVPGTLVGVGLIGIWNRPGPLGGAVWDRRDARAGLPRAPSPSRGPRPRRQRPHGARVARRSGGRQAALDGCGP